MEFSINNQEIISAVSIIVNIILVSIIILQYKSSQKQYELVNRPWLIFEQTDKDIDEHFPLWSLENIGNIPAEKIEITSKYFMKLDKHDDIHNKKSGVLRTDIIMPKQKYLFVLNDITFTDLNQCNSFESDIFIKYQFLNQKKTSHFRFYKNNDFDHQEISCVKAD